MVNLQFSFSRCSVIFSSFILNKHTICYAIHVPFELKYHPRGLINDMQMSTYNRKQHALSHSLHCVRQEGRLALKVVEPDLLAKMATNTNEQVLRPPAAEQVA